MFTLLTCLLLCSACHQEPKDHSTQLVLDWLPNPNHIPLYAGINEGFFVEQGIQLEIIKVPDPGDSVPYLLSHQADLCITYMPHAIHACKQGAQLVPVGILVDEPLNSIIYRKEEGIKSPEDLDQKIIGFAMDGYGSDFVDALLAPKNIHPKDYRNVSFDLVAMLATKQVDAIYGAYWNIECENLRSLGVKTDYFSLTELGCPNYYELIVFANQTRKEASKEFGETFQRAMQRSIDFAIAHPDKAFEHYVNANPDKSPKVLLWEKQAWLMTIPALAKTQHFDTTIWDNFKAWIDVNLK